MVFTAYISYSQKDKELVDLLYSVLKQSGINTYALDATILPAMERDLHLVPEQIRKYVSSSDYVFVLLTKDAIKSPNIFFEIGLAKALSKRILLITEPGLRLPNEISDLPSIVLDRKNPNSTIEQIRQLSSKLKSEKEAGDAAVGILLLLGALAFFAWLSSENR
jgi:hypothetical protein